MKTHLRIVLMQLEMSKSNLLVPIMGCKVKFDQGAGSYGVRFCFNWQADKQFVGVQFGAKSDDNRGCGWRCRRICAF